MHTYHIHPVAIAHTPYPEKFAVPRQPRLVYADNSYLRLLGDCNREEIVRGLDGFSHLWLSFIFHHAQREQWKPTVRPPRLGGNERIGVFASRSPFRPNPLGLSAVKLGRIECVRKEWRIYISGADLVNGTPVVDIKPYLPYADSIPNAVGGFASIAPTPHNVTFSASARKQLLELNICEQQTALITQVLAQQPQPAFHTAGRDYGMALVGLNIRWRFDEHTAHVFDITEDNKS